jgi:NADPH:quinone reductase-like Zn-dependent oxidoreductase
MTAREGYRPAFAYQGALTAGGRYYFVGGAVSVLLQILLLGPWIRIASGRRLHLLMVEPNARDVLRVAELYQAGTLTPVIDRRYSLSAGPEALRYLGDGHARGKVVIIPPAS